MSYASRETSQFSGAPYELYQFSTESRIWRLTSADEKKTYQGAIFDPEAIIHTPASQGNELKSGTITVTIPRDHEIAQLFTAYIPTSPMFLTIYRAHDGEPDDQTVTHWTGKVQLCKLGDEAELSCSPEQDVLKKRIPPQEYQTPCNRILFAPGCDVDKNVFRVLGTLTFVSGDTIKAAAFATKPDGWFNNGYIESGTERRMIINHAGDTLTLITGMASLSVGEDVFAYAGCDRFYSGDCVNKFNNGPNHFGFPFIPTKNPFSGLE